MRWCLRLLPLAIPALGLACDSASPPTKRGELGSIAFAYTCVGASDPFCDGATPAFDQTKFPIIGVGASFSLASDSSVAVSLDPARIAGQTAVKSGFAPMGDVYCTDVDSHCPDQHPYFLHDIVHVKIAAPTALRITHPDPQGSYTQVLGVDNFSFTLPADSFRALLVDDAGNPLAGAPSCLWTTSNPAVLVIESPPDSNVVHFRVVGSGKADLHLKLGTFETTVPFNIQ